MVVSLIVPMGSAVRAEQDHGVAVIRIAGPVDATAEPVLANTARQLAALRPQTVFVDLGAITSAEPPLIRFLDQIVASLPRTGVLLLCGVGPAIRVLIDAHSPALTSHVSDVPAPFRHTRVFAAN